MLLLNIKGQTTISKNNNNNNKTLAKFESIQEIVHKKAFSFQCISMLIECAENTSTVNKTFLDIVAKGRQIKQLSYRTIVTCYKRNTFQ